MGLHSLVAGAGRLVQSGLIAPHSLALGGGSQLRIGPVQVAPYRQRPSLRIEPRHEPTRQHAGHAAAIMARGEGRLHRHDLVAHKRVESIEYARVERAAAQFRRPFEQHRAWIGAGERDAQIGQRVVLPA